MNGDELKTLREKLDMTQAEFSSFIGTGLRQYQKWEAGDAPIRPVMATGIRNAAALIDVQRTVAQAKKIQDKNDTLKQVLSVFVEGLMKFGADEYSCGRLIEMISKNKVPTTEDAQRVLSSVYSPESVSSHLKAIVSGCARKAEKSSGDFGVDLFSAQMVEFMGADGIESFKEWAFDNFVMTSSDVLQSVYKASVK
ncbi:DUF1870 family protein [Pseudomonas syringae pv. actinidiae]|nr:DUF1870 family protein [Pseudomonas syringae pv. actinidiae]